MAITITGGPSSLHCHCGNDNGNADAASVKHLLEVRQSFNCYCSDVSKS